MSVDTAEALVAGLRAALPDNLASFSRGVLAVAPAKCLAIDDLLSPRHCSEIMSYLETRLGALDRRAALSIWTGWHFRSVVPPLLAANILLDASPRLDLDGLRFVISADMRAEGIVIPAAPVDALTHAHGAARFAGLVDTYLAPLIDRFADRTRLTRRVLWSNAGQVFEGFLRVLEPKAAGRPGFAAAKEVLAAPRQTDGSRNPLFEPVRYVEGRRIRRICCMRYLFPDRQLCGPCPLVLRRLRPTAEDSAAGQAPTVR